MEKVPRKPNMANRLELVKLIDFMVLNYNPETISFQQPE